MNRENFKSYYIHFNLMKNLPNNGDYLSVYFSNVDTSTGEVRDITINNQNPSVIYQVKIPNIMCEMTYYSPTSGKTDQTQTFTINGTTWNGGGMIPLYNANGCIYFSSVYFGDTPGVSLDFNKSCHPLK